MHDLVRISNSNLRPVQKRRVLLEEIIRLPSIQTEQLAFVEESVPMRQSVALSAHSGKGKRSKFYEYHKMAKRESILDIVRRNEDLNLKRKYKSIVCTRTLYFCKDPLKFVTQCKDFLLPGGEIFIDFGLGNHWTKFEKFKVGWIKDGEHEWEYFEKKQEILL